MQVARSEENQQLVALAAAATVFSHFWMQYKINMVSSYIYMGGFETQRDFHKIQEHPKRTSDEEVMVIRSWRTQPENPVGRTCRGLLFSVIFGHNLSSSCIKLYMGEF